MNCWLTSYLLGGYGAADRQTEVRACRRGCAGRNPDHSRRDLQCLSKCARASGHCLARVVFSTTLCRASAWPNTRLEARDAVEAVREMKQNRFESMRTMGSLTLSSLGNSRPSV